MNDKARFRLLREAVGMTQAAMARELGVEVRSVKRWESQEAPQMPPQDAWDLLGDALAEQDRAVAAALGAPPARLPYWTSEGEHAQWADDPSADWRMDDATQRRIWAALRDRGLEPEVVDGRGGHRHVSLREAAPDAQEHVAEAIRRVRGGNGEDARPTSR